MRATQIQDFSTIPSENKLSYGATFEEVQTINKQSGSAFSEAAYSQGGAFMGSRQIQSYNDTGNTDLVFNFGDAITARIELPGKYFLGVFLKQNQNPLQYYPLKLDITMFLDGIESQKMEITLPEETDENPDTTNLVKDNYYGFFIPFELNNSAINKVATFSFNHKGVSTVTNNSTIWIDGLFLQYNNRANTVPSFYMPPSNVEKKTQVIDFPSIADGASNTQTFAFPYAALNNKVDVIPTVAIRALGLTFEACVSTPGNVSVKATNNTGGAVDLPSADYLIILTK